MEVMAKVDRLHNRMLSKQRYFEDPGEKITIAISILEE